MTLANLGVCSWCIDRGDVIRAIRFVGTELDLRITQLGFFTARAVDTASSEAIRRMSGEVGVRIIGSFVGFEGEDYASIEQIGATGGYRPDNTYRDRLRITRQVAALTAACGGRSVAVHAATIPDDPASVLFGTLVDRVREVAQAVASEGVALLLETGRERIETLRRFLDALGRDDVGVNFDPGNLLVYGTDAPVEAVSTLGDRIRIVHLKDAVRSARPGIEYGHRAALGDGDARIADVVGRLKALGYTGPLLLEVRPGAGNPRDFAASIEYVRSLLC
jgi:sugar phosphate isomerase/epimerase